MTPKESAMRAAVEALEGAEQWLEGWASAEPYLSRIRSALSLLRAELEAGEPSECGNTPYDEGPFTLAASPTAAAKEEGEPIGEIVLFGGDLKEVSWRKGKMPEPGTKLYTRPITADTPQRPVIFCAGPHHEACPECVKAGRCAIAADTQGDAKALVQAIAGHIDGWRSATFSWQDDPDPAIAAKNEESAVQAHAAECIRRIRAALDRLVTRAPGVKEVPRG